MSRVIWREYSGGIRAVSTLCCTRSCTNSPKLRNTLCAPAATARPAARYMLGTGVLLRARRRSLTASRRALMPEPVLFETMNTSASAILRSEGQCDR